MMKPHHWPWLFFGAGKRTTVEHQDCFRGPVELIRDAITKFLTSVNLSYSLTEDDEVNKGTAFYLLRRVSNV